MPRWIARIFAWLGGYFWLPCPRCGRMFAGFEGKGSIPNPDTLGGWMTCCPPYRFHAPSRSTHGVATTPPSQKKEKE